MKLQRNAKLAAALNIDPATHLDDHIPYSQVTLDLFKDSPKFCQQYEREFRVFASDDKEKRMRFKPMQATQRAFIHALAEDFGLDSESQDPEPHRHVSNILSFFLALHYLGKWLRYFVKYPNPLGQFQSYSSRRFGTICLVSPNRFEQSIIFFQTFGTICSLTTIT